MTADGGAPNFRAKLRDGLIVSTHLTSLPRVRNYLWRRAGRSLTRIVCFHKVPDLEVFERKIRLLRRHYAVVPLDAFLAGAVVGDGINICVTFDDGYASWLDALPVLERYEVPATFFVCSGYLDCTTRPEWERFCRERLGLRNPEPSIGWDGAQALARHPLFQVGGHTRHHASLGELEPADQVVREVADDRQMLQVRLGQEVRHFAYPFGLPASISTAARAAVQQAGYQSAATAIPGPNTSGRDRFLLYRDCLDEVSSGLIMQAWLEGGYDFWKSLQLRRSPLRV